MSGGYNTRRALVRKACGVRLGVRHTEFKLEPQAGGNNVALRFKPAVAPGVTAIATGPAAQGLGPVRGRE
jgi:hypothetical protein